MTAPRAAPHPEGMSGDDLTVSILEQIRDELRATNAEVKTLNAEVKTIATEAKKTNERLDATNERLDATNERLDATNERLDTTNERLDAQGARLDRLAEGQIRVATEVATLRGEVTKQGDRLENAILTGGQMFQGFRQRLDRLERHVGLEPA